MTHDVMTHAYQQYFVIPLLQVDGRFELIVKIDGVVKKTKIAYKPQTFTNIKVFAGDEWYGNPADADIKNFKFENIKGTK